MEILKNQPAFTEKEQARFSFNSHPFTHISTQSDKSQMFIQKLHSVFWLADILFLTWLTAARLLDLHLNSVDGC